MEVFAVVGLYIAGVIGAGFASGQELVVFFVNYGRGGLGGIILTFCILTLGVVVTLKLCTGRQVASYEDLLKLMGQGNPKTTLALDIFYSFFLFIGVSVMIAGSRALNPILGLLTPALVFVILHRGKEAVLQLGTPLALILVLALGSISLIALKNTPSRLSETTWWSGLEAGLLYSSYNFGFSLALLASIQHVLKTPTQRWAVALFGNGILLVLLVLVYFALGTLSPEQLGQPFPCINLAQTLGPLAVRLYQFMLWLAMYTTALTNSLALVARVTKVSRLSWSSLSLTVTLGALLFSYFGFTILIKVAYPLLGLAGIWIMANLLRLTFV